MTRLLFLVFLSVCASKGIPHPSGNDPDEPLILTPYLKSGDIEKARNLSYVQPLLNNITSYSGYFTVDEQCGSNMFFWFFPAEAEYKTMPLGIWLQGGPGATSLYGLFTEIGPLMLTPDNSLKRRASSWTRAASYLFIDNPVGTGFSFSNGPPESCFSRNETQVGKNLLEVVRQFLTLFPELVANKLFVTGESYAGKYVPALSYAIHEYNRNQPPGPKINLAGLAIGNGLVDPPNMLHYGDYLYEIGLIDDTTRKIFQKEEDRCRSLIANGQFAKAFETFDRLMMGDLTGTPSFFSNVTGYSHYFNYLLSEPPKEADFDVFFNNTDIRKSIHVGSRPFASLGSKVEEMLREDMMQSVAPWLQELLDNNYKILIYNGQLDIIVAYPLTEAYVRKLNWTLSDEYRSATRSPWYVGKELAGYVKTVGNLTEVVVRNAGHMVPADQPRWALALIKSFARLNDFIKLNEIHIDPRFVELVLDHLQQLQQNLLFYFPNLEEPDDEWQWLNNPFLIDPENKPTSMSDSVFESLIEISEDPCLKQKHHDVFWMHVYQENHSVGSCSEKAPPF